MAQGLDPPRGLGRRWVAGKDQKGLAHAPPGWPPAEKAGHEPDRVNGFLAMIDFRFR
jgi:hypothetical protein